jgi:hypothetical protein
MRTLSDVCTILTGFTARGRLEPAEQDGILALQLRDISPSGSIASDRRSGTLCAQATSSFVLGVNATRRPLWMNRFLNLRWRFYHS